MRGKPIAVALSLVLATAAALFSQATNSLRFDVASIKRNTTADPRLRQLGSQPGGRLVAVNAPVKMLIQNAYQLRPYQVLGGPGWIDSDGYDIDVRAEAGKGGTPRETLGMLQSLLEDRFKLKAHRDTRDLPIYVLQPAKNGLTLPSSKAGNCLAPDPNGPPAPPPPPVPGQPPRQRCGTAGVSISPQGTRIFGGQISIAEFARVLSIVVARPVVDRTGFTGTFDADLAFLPDQATSGLPNPGPGLLPPPDPTAVTIFTALQEQLGLKLDSDKGPVEVLIIESVDRPTEN
jgi:uncharacterized protein (TIGR03435 family)